MNITYDYDVDEQELPCIYKGIHRDISAFLQLTVKTRNHPRSMSFTEWYHLLLDMLEGIDIYLKFKNPDAQQKKKIERGLFLVCRYFYDMRH